MNSQGYARFRILAPALLMRNTDDDPTWTALVYHDHVSWFPGGAYVVEKLFSADGRRIVIKAVNYDGVAHTTLVRLHGSRAPVDAAVTRFTVSANPNEAATFQQPNRITPVMTSMAYTKDLTIDLPAYSVAVVEIAAR